MKKINFNSKSCINISTETYSGKECSPKGLGYSAITYSIGHEMTGVDKQIWSVQMKNGKKVWFRKSGMPVLTHEEPLITNPHEDPVINPITIENKIDEKKEEITDEVVEKKVIKTDYSIFYSYYSNKLKTEYMEKGEKKEAKDIRDETIETWNKLKKNKKELQELLNIIKNKR